MLIGLLFAGVLFCTAAATDGSSPSAEIAPGPLPVSDTPAIHSEGTTDPRTAGLFEAWETMASLPSARVFCAVATQGDYVYVIGGSSHGSEVVRTNTTYRYDTGSDTWEAMAPLPENLTYADAVTLGDKIYVPGDDTTGTTYMYDIPGDTWSEIAANNGYSARMQYEAVASGSDVVVLGGQVSGVTTNETWRLNTTTGTWSAGVAIPGDRMNFAAAGSGNRIVITGGISRPGSIPVMTTWVFNGTAWNSGASVPDGGGAYTRWSYMASGQGRDGDLWLAGGRRDAGWTVLGDTGVYHTGNNTWSTTPGLPVLNQPRVYTSGTIAADGYFYVAGGRDSMSTIYDNFERLRVEDPPLEARFSAAPLSGTAPLTVNFTDSSAGLNITGRDWDFGDGNSTWSTTSTRFTHGYAPGSYSVNLTVSNDTATSSLLRTAYINVSLPVNSIKPASGSRGTVVKVKNLSGVYFETGANVTLTKGSRKIKGKAVNVTSPVKITCTFRIPASAAKGKWNVTVTNPGGISGTLVKGFTVKA